MPFSKVGVAIMTHVKLYFSSRGQQEPVFGLICGDCLVHDDEDEAWRYPELNNPLNKGTPDGINLKGLHLPFISPTPNVLAVPVHTSILKLSFQSVFEACFTFSRSTSSYPSCFSVLVLSSALSTALTSLISFSPNEYQNLCDLLTNLSFKKVQEECISLTFLWEFLTTVAANDCALLFQLLSLVRRRLRFIRTPNAASTSKRARNEHHESVRWIQKMVECSVSHYCSSWRELIQMRIKVAQWLLSMDAHDALCSFFSEEGVLSYSHSKEVTCDCLITIKAVSHMSWTSIYCLSLPEVYVAAHLYLRLLDLATAESLFTAIISRCSNNSSLMEMSTAGFTTRIKRRTIFSKTIKSIISLRARQKNSYA